MENGLFTMYNVWYLSNTTIKQKKTRSKTYIVWKFILRSHFLEAEGLSTKFFVVSIKLITQQIACDLV